MKLDIKNIKLPNLNAVLYRDMKQKTKKVRLVMDVFIANLFLSLIATIVLLAMCGQAASYEAIEYSTFSIFFIVLVFIEFAFIAFLTPALTANAITGEREKQTFDVLLTTRLTTWQIITGKFWASILQVLLLILSGLPIFSLVFIYGGTNFFQALAVLFVLMVAAMFIASVGIFASSIAKKGIVATVLAYMLLFGLLFGTISVTVMVRGIGELLQESLRYNWGIDSPFDGSSILFLLYVNPLATVYDSLSMLGVDFFDLGTHGMASIVAAVTDFSKNNILLRFWSIFSLIIQGGLTFGLLKLSARAIDPLRKRKAKKVKNAKRQKKTN